MSNAPIDVSESRVARWIDAMNRVVIGSWGGMRGSDLPAFLRALADDRDHFAALARTQPSGAIYRADPRTDIAGRLDRIETLIAALAQFTLYDTPAASGERIRQLFADMRMANRTPDRSSP
jgi:hypothetical protein